MKNAWRKNSQTILGRMSKKTRTYARVLLGALSHASEKEAAGIARRFKFLLQKRGDVRILSAVVREFQRLWEERKGKVASVVSAKELPLGSALEQELKRRGYRPRKEYDKELIGGTAVFLGKSYLVDNSIRGKLQRIQKLVQSL